MVFIFIVHVNSINDVAIAPADARFALFHFHYATTVEEEEDQDEGVPPFLSVPGVVWLDSSNDECSQFYQSVARL